MSVRRTGPQGRALARAGRWSCPLRPCGCRTRAPCPGSPCGRRCGRGRGPALVPWSRRSEGRACRTPVVGGRPGGAGERSPSLWRWDWPWGLPPLHGRLYDLFGVGPAGQHQDAVPAAEVQLCGVLTITLAYEEPAAWRRRRRGLDEGGAVRAGAPVDDLARRHWSHVEDLERPVHGGLGLACRDDVEAAPEG